MGRNLEFDMDAALDAALEVFWTRSYRSTSMVDLENATGLKPGSLYNAFGSKKGLFLRIIDRYIDTVVVQRIDTILKSGEPMAGIEAFFRTAYDDLEPDQMIGCMLTNTATEIGHDDPDVREKISAGIDLIEEAFRVRLAEAQSAGALGTGRDASTLAAHLASCYQGLGVLGRLTRNKARLDAVTEAALASLR